MIIVRIAFRNASFIYNMREEKKPRSKHKGHGRAIKASIIDNELYAASDALQSVQILANHTRKCEYQCQWKLSDEFHKQSCVISMRYRPDFG